jgi:hypothetical protein
MAQVIKQKKLIKKSGIVMASILKEIVRTLFDMQIAKIKIKEAVATMALSIAKTRN